MIEFSLLEAQIIGFLGAGVGLLCGFILGRKTARNAILPQLEALVNRPFVPPEQPQFTNYPGTQGLFLGRFQSTFRDGWGYDLYYNAVSPKAVIARYGNGHAEFDMALCTESEDDNPEALAEALRRVRDSGL